MNKILAMNNQSIFKSFAKILSTTAIASLVGLSIQSSQALEVYKSIGAHGEVKYSQHMPRDAKNVEVIQLRSDGRRVDPGQLAGKTDPNEAPKTPTAEEQRVAQLEARLKEQEAQANAQRCQSLRNNLTNLNVGGKIYEMDANGNRKYLDSREIELKRQRMQAAIQQYCSGSTT